MEDLDGRVAVVTGGASGIGLALARTLAAEGMHLVLADVEAGALDEAAASLAGVGKGSVSARVCDVSSAESVRALADAAFAEHGAVHVVCLNAGVSSSGLTWQQTEADWAWVLGVNLWGVVHGIRAFVPRMVEAGEDGHVVATSSMSGMAPGPGVGAYGASKAGVIALMESLHMDLSATDSRVRAHVLLPSFTRTRILESQRNRPDALGPGRSAADGTPESGMDRSRVQALLAQGQDPAEVADCVLRAIRADRFWIVPHEPSLERARVRFESILALSNPPVMLAGTVPGARSGAAGLGAAPAGGAPADPGSAP
jgi:NAD(P)-dependent dehydrogenase (short-subunit alcohol dehydrogenase family)